MSTAVVAPRPGKSLVFSHTEGEAACGGRGDAEPDTGGRGDAEPDNGGSGIVHWTRGSLTSPSFPPGDGLGHAGADSELRCAADPGWRGHQGRPALLPDIPGGSGGLRPGE